MTDEHSAQPEWERSFRRFLKFSQETSSALRASIDAIESYNKYNDFIREQLEHSPNLISRAYLSEVNKLKFLVEHQRDTKFIIILYNAVVSLWASLEVTMNDFIEILIEYRGRKGDKKLKNDSKKIRYGVCRFEWQLAALELGADIPGEFARHLVELSEVRNVIVHRFGLIDEKFISNLKSAIPNELVYSGMIRRSDLRVGSRVVVLRQDYTRYSDYVEKYILSVIDRARDAGI